MKKLDLGTTITVLANVGVLGGLVFVGFQLRQDREIALAAVRQEQVDSEMYWAELVHENSELWVRGLAGEALSIAEVAEFRALASALETKIWVEYMHAQGLLDFDSGRLVRQWAAELRQNPGLMTWWQNSQSESQYVNPNPISSWVVEVNAELLRLNNVTGAAQIRD